MHSLRRSLHISSGFIAGLTGEEWVFARANMICKGVRKSARSICEKGEATSRRGGAMENAIEVSHLTKQYPLRGDKRTGFRRSFLGGKSFRTALQDVSFSAKTGECLGVIGLNGSGKSTLLKILAGVARQSEGDVAVRGSCAALLELGAAFHPEYTGLQNISLFMLLQGFSEKDTKQLLPNILSFAELGEKIKEPVKTYSSGQYVRLAFAAATAVKPDVLLVDEALSVGDVFFQQKCWKRMREYAGSTTILFVSHDMSAVTKFCPRTLVLDGGKLVFDGPSRDAVSAFYGIVQGSAKSVFCEGEAEEGQEETAPGDSQMRSADEEGMESGARKACIGWNRQPSISKEGVCHNFRLTDIQQCSGAGDAFIERYAWLVDGAPFKETCVSEQRVEISFTVHLMRKMVGVIIGYQVRDRYGTEVFGETSLTSGFGCPTVEAGFMEVSFSFCWPEIREGDYFITLGIGEGTEVLCQKEQCWVNQAIHLRSSPAGNKLIYGILNREMEDFSLKYN